MYRKMPFYVTNTSWQNTKKIENILENEFVTPEFIETDHGIGHYERHGETGFDSRPALDIVEDSLFFMFPFEKKKSLDQFMEWMDDNFEYYTSWQNHSTDYAGIDYRLQYEVTPLGKSTRNNEGGFLVEFYWSTED